MYHLYVRGGSTGRLIRSFKIMGCDALTKAVDTVKEQVGPANINAIWAIDLDGVIYVLHRG